MRVREHLDAFFAATGLAREGYTAPHIVLRLGPLALAFPNPGRLPIHDIHHVALDVPPTFWGEVEISAFELRTGPPSWLIAFLCVGALVLGFMHSPRRVVRAWRSFRGARNLYADPRDIEDLRDLELDALRAWMRVGRFAVTASSSRHTFAA
jgi:hypothetical protein